MEGAGACLGGWGGIPAAKKADLMVVNYIIIEEECPTYIHIKKKNNQIKIIWIPNKIIKKLAIVVWLKKKNY